MTTVPDLAALNPGNIVAFIGEVFDKQGANEYLGEPVTIGEHMLQGARLAENGGQDEETIVAALLHDIGHFTSAIGTFAMTDEEDRASQLVSEHGEYDPTKDLEGYLLPPLELMKDYVSTGVSVSKEELETNKDRIVETLSHYKIDIAKIKATVGPTVTLYEIVPAPGVRISKIKNLEDDIALSLSALGIRIIAPIPGKGTVGIEVPNPNPDIVSMHTAISSKAFQEAEMELPLALGKTITNETYTIDLAKMPHLLMAGATGQGKSVGLNAILVSLLYRKHPSELKDKHVWR